jgi:hypothetical protein
MATSTKRVNSYRERMAAIKRFKREPYLTIEEWVIIKARIVELRKGKS